MPLNRSPGADIWFETNRKALSERWFELLRIPSVSSENAHRGDCRTCAEWWCTELGSVGFASSLRETTGHPLVLAERPADRRGLPAVLFYGHYDVQPVAPLELWSQPDPFEPVIRGDRVYARGAQDNKGQSFFALQALRHLIEANVPLPRIQVLLDGEEECGSSGLRNWLGTLKDPLRADLLLVCDTGMASDGRPAIVAGLRGIFDLEINLQGASHDLHSGQHGGLAPNAAMGLARLLATLHKPDGSIAVSGFLDGLQEPDAGEVAEALAQPFDAEEYRDTTGAEPVGGEAGLAPAIRTGFRPTLEINGLHGGYGGPGSKTIIPATAQAKLSARLCPDQDPQKCLEALKTHLQKNTPAGLQLTFKSRGGHAAGFRLRPDSEAIRKGRTILDKLDPRGSVLLWEGASIPVVGDLAQHTGAQPLLVGFGREEDRIHAPDESYSWFQAQMCFQYHTALFRELGAAQFVLPDQQKLR